jgi:hypothetical protein
MKSIPQAPRPHYFANKEFGLGDVFASAVRLTHLKRLIDHHLSEMIYITTEFEPCGSEPIRELTRAKLAIESRDEDLALSWLMSACNGWIEVDLGSKGWWGSIIVPGVKAPVNTGFCEVVKNMINLNHKIEFNEMYSDSGEDYYKEFRFLDTDEGEFVTVTRSRTKVMDTDFWSDEVYVETQWENYSFHMRELAPQWEQIFN